MNVATLILGELFGMFVDDEFLAIAVLAVVAVAGALALSASAPALVAGGVLLGGCVGVVMTSVLRASRKARKG